MYLGLIRYLIGWKFSCFRTNYTFVLFALKFRETKKEKRERKKVEVMVKFKAPRIIGNLG